VSLGAACGGAIPPVRLPPEATEPAPDAVAAWEQATTLCRSAASYSAEIHLSGRVGETGRKGTLRGALSAANEIYLALSEPIGPPGFVLSGRGDRATLVVPRDKRVLVAPAADIIEALTGMRLEPRELMAVLTGCVVPGGSAGSGGRAGDERAVTVGASRVWMQRVHAGWRVTAGARPGLSMVYRTYGPSAPTEIGIASSGDAAVPFEFQVRVEQVVFDSPQVSAATFTPHPPAGATPLSLEELRRIGPLGEKKQ
jgi:hypothetical protein